MKLLMAFISIGKQVLLFHRGYQGGLGLYIPEAGNASTASTWLVSKFCRQASYSLKYLTKETSLVNLEQDYTMVACDKQTTYTN
jgi:hypothetical protein